MLEQYEVSFRQALNKDDVKEMEEILMFLDQWYCEANCDWDEMADLIAGLDVLYEEYTGAPFIKSYRQMLYREEVE